ncbi:hypothetical protein QE152_g34056 [Popillia japonica]|uniref:Craniofacial development protein 2-like n=1 Tax=Popillia japonica TaxID=7064 RepID=A0AAW1IUV8_POPJA
MNEATKPDKLDTVINMLREMTANMHQMREEQQEKENEEIRTENARIKAEYESIKTNMEVLKKRMDSLEKEKRMLNVVLTGMDLEAHQSEDLQQIVEEFIEQKLEVKASVKTATKLGRKTCLISFRQLDDKVKVLKNKKDKDEDIKTRFYEELEEVLNKIPKFDIKCLIGDMNAKVGREEEYSVTTTTGGKSLHKVSNDNGKRLIEFALENSMKIVSTAFDHKDIHKETWIAPNGLTKNQIDHVLIEMKHAKNITNVRSYRGADADSDHILVITEMMQIATIF